MDNIYILDTSMSSTKYCPTSDSYPTFHSHTFSPEKLQGKDVCMGNLMCFIQGYPAQKSWVTELVDIWDVNVSNKQAVI